MLYTVHKQKKSDNYDIVAVTSIPIKLLMSLNNAGDSQLLVAWLTTRVHMYNYGIVRLVGAYTGYNRCSEK